VAVIEQASSVSLRRGPQVAPRAEPKNRAVVAWAVVGVAFIALMIYVFAAWIFSHYFRHEGPGVTPVPTYMEVAGVAQEVLGAAGMLAILYLVAWRPWRRAGGFSTDGLFVLGMMWCWWQDPLYSYTTSSFSYSSVTWNMGGWACKIPGFQSPNGCNIPQPLIWDIAFYVIGMAGGTILAAALLRRWRARKPEVSNVTMLVALFAAFWIADLVCEGLWVRLGLYHYGGGVKGWELFAGKWYEFPLYEPIAVALMMTGMTAVRFFVNDRGETIVERGTADLRLGARGKTLVRFLAIVGVLNVCMLVLWAGTTNLFNIHAGAWPKSIQQQSYLDPGICGPGTSYACPGAGVSIPRAGSSAHVSPTGKVVIPPGTDTSQFAPVKYSTK
jgi:hypothetical protein